MVVRKIMGLALLPLICTTLFACKHSDDVVKIPDIKNQNVEVRHPFKEGYYVGDEYTLQIVYVGNKTEHSYGVSVRDDLTGSEEFFGVVYSVSPGAMSLTVPGYSNTSAMIFIDKLEGDGEDHTVKITDLSENGISAALCGEYSYSGTEWQPASAIESDVITSGVYVNNEYTLTVDRGEDAIAFSVCSSDGEELFCASSRGGDHNVVMIGSENSYYRFAKLQKGNGTYIDVSAVGCSDECDYFGKYILVQ